MTLLMNRMAFTKLNLKVFSILGKHWKSLALVIRHNFTCFAGVTCCFAKPYSLACACNHQHSVGTSLVVFLDGLSFHAVIKYVALWRDCFSTWQPGSPRSG